MIELQLMRAFDSDIMNLMPANKESAFFITENIPSHQVFSVWFKGHSTRTDQQRKAIEVYCRLLAEALNEAGYDMLHFPWKDGVLLPWSQSSAKDRLWREVQLPLLNKYSTTSLEKHEVDAVYQVLSRKIAETCGVSVEFPHREVE